MKIVTEHINEKFTEQGNPIENMDIGLRGLIKRWCIEYDIHNFRINDDFTIDVIDDWERNLQDKDDFKEGINRMSNFINDGRVDIKNYQDEKLPEYIKFNKVEGYFSITHSNLKTLKGFPKVVVKNFWCSHNKLSSLNYCPKIVDGSFICHHNLKYFDKDYILSKCKTERSKIQN